MKEMYDRAWRSVISPNKFTHAISAYCPKVQLVEGKRLERIDFSFKNEDGKLISGIILKEEHINPEHTILYLHGNGGSKLECLGFAPIICLNRIAVVGFDFVGCGNSDPGYLTYGINETKDAELVIREVRKHIKMGKLSVWGRSMGAATAILLAQKNRQIIHSLVLDSAFRRLSNVIKRVIKNETELPRGLVGLAFYFLSESIHEKLKFSLFHLDYLQVYCRVSKYLPTLFFYSQSDLIVPKEEVFEFYNACRGEKNLVKIAENHEEQRSLSVFEEGVEWVRRKKAKRSGKIKLSYMNDSLELERLSVKPGTGFFCCNK